MPHRYLSFCVLGFGVTTLLQGFVTNYAGLLATRFFLVCTYLLLSLLLQVCDSLRLRLMRIPNRIRDSSRLDYSRKRLSVRPFVRVCPSGFH